MGHIDLAAPVSHIWFFKGVPSRIGYILDLAPKELEKVLYFAASIVTKVDTAKRDADLGTLQEQVDEAVQQYVQERDIRAQELRERLERRVNWLRENETTGFDVEDEFWVEDIAFTRDPENPDAPPVPREIPEAERKSIESELRKETDALVRDDEPVVVSISPCFLRRAANGQCHRTDPPHLCRVGRPNTRQSLTHITLRLAGPNR